MDMYAQLRDANLLGWFVSNCRPTAPVFSIHVQTNKLAITYMYMYLTWNGLLIRMVTILHWPQVTLSKSISDLDSWRAGLVTTADSCIEYTGPPNSYM